MYAEQSVPMGPLQAQRTRSFPALGMLGGMGFGCAGPVETGAGEIGTGKIGSGEVGMGEVGIKQIGLDQEWISRAHAPKVAPAELYLFSHELELVRACYVPTCGLRLGCS